MRGEEWSPIHGYDGVYSISSLGRVRRDAGGKGATAGRILTTKRNRKGYRHVDLSRDDVKERRLVHQIVADAFLPPRPSDAHHPNHVDADKSNNSAANLEWATAAENNTHARMLGLVPAMRGECNGRAKLTVGDVAEIHALKGLASQRAIAGRFGVARSLIQRIHQGRAWADEWPLDLRVREFPEARR